MWRLVVAVLCLFSARAQANRPTVTPPATMALQAGNIALEASDYDLAWKKLIEAVNLDRSYLEVVCPKLGYILGAKKKFVEAVKLLRSCPDQDDLRVREMLGVSLFQTGTREEAAKILETVLRDDPSSVAAALELGQYYRETAPKKAIAAFETYLQSEHKNDPSLDRQVHQKLAFLYLHDQRWDAARHAFEALLRANPNDVYSKVGLGTSYVGGGDCGNAIAVFERLLGEAPRQPSIYYNLALCYAKTGRRADAQRALSSYMRVRPDDPKATKLEHELQSAP